MSDVKMTPPEGPMAFPCCVPFNGGTFTAPGMTLRDYFTGQALAGLCANASAMFGDHYQGDPGAIAMLAGQFADAMLAARGDA